MKGSDTPEQSYGDLRASSNPQKRFRAQKAKYYSFHAVHPGQLGRPHYTIPHPDAANPWPVFPAPISSSTITTLSKRDLYRLAQETAPRDQHSHCTCNVKVRKRGRRAAGWRRLKLRDEGYEWHRGRQVVSDYSGECESDSGDDTWSNEAASWGWSACFDAEERESVEPLRVGNRFGVLADVGKSTYDLATLVGQALDRREGSALREMGWIDVGIELKAESELGPGQSDLDDWVEDEWSSDEDALWDYPMV